MFCFGALVYERILLKANPRRREAISIVVAGIIYRIAGIELMISGIYRVIKFGMALNFIHKFLSFGQR
tara:strand:+ start:88 stop:291 length:204 start_codon:yes stop_codon:yes gene_type:complete